MTKAKPTTKTKQAKSIAVDAPAANLPALVSESAYGDTGKVMSIIEQVMKSSRRLDVDKLERLLAVQERLMAKQAEINFTTAMNELQMVMPRVTMKGRIKFEDRKGNQRDTPYGKYEDIDLVLRPLLKQYGFTLSFTSINAQQGIVIRGIVRHKDGHSDYADTPPMPRDMSGKKNELQGMGSSISYGQRYVVKQLFNIVFEGEDDDGASFVGAPDEGESFSNRVKAESAGVIIDAEEGKLLDEYDDFKSKLLTIKTKKARIEHINKNLAFMKRLSVLKEGSYCQSLHEIADKGV